MREGARCATRVNSVTSQGAGERSASAWRSRRESRRRGGEPQRVAAALPAPPPPHAAAARAKRAAYSSSLAVLKTRTQPRRASWGRRRGLGAAGQVTTASARARQGPGRSERIKDITTTTQEPLRRRRGLPWRGRDKINDSERAQAPRPPKTTKKQALDDL